MASIGKQNWVLAATSNSNPFAVFLASTVSSNLAHGRLYRYDRQWHLLGRSAASLSDIVSIAALGDGALVSDLSQRSLWQLDQSGQALREIRLPGMDQADAAFQKWASIAQGTLFLFVIALVLGFAWAIRDARQCKAAAALKPPRDVAVVTERGTGAGVEIWLQPVGLLRYGPALLIVLIVVYVGWLSYLLSIIKPFDPELLGLMLAMLVMAVSPLPMLHYAGRCKLGVLGSSVRIRTPDGRTVAAEGANITMNRHLIAIDDVVLPIRNRYGGLFWEADKMKQWVMPQLQQARRFRVLEPWKISWRTSFWPMLFPAACVFVAVLILVGLRLP